MGLIDEGLPTLLARPADGRRGSRRFRAPGYRHDESILLTTRRITAYPRGMVIVLPGHAQWT
jgi:hypothetical protein